MSRLFWDQRTADLIVFGLGLLGEMENGPPAVVVHIFSGTDTRLLHLYVVFDKKINKAFDN